MLLRLLDVLSNFVFFYPLVMSLVWISGALLFRSRLEKNQEETFKTTQWPKVSVLIPCYNEADTIEETITMMDRLPYPDFEIIAVNDGSKDNTGELLHSLVLRFERLRIIDIKQNRGKANALKVAAHASKAEYLVCVDSDAVLDDYAIHHLIDNFMFHGERLGAVTGNPRIRNRDTLLAKLQILEYASIIGAIKRAQRILGKIMTVSGVVVAFRKKALLSVNLWDSDMITEDISVSWKLQEKFWDIRYEPKALCWMLVPETIKGIWKQRIRWAQGGQEVLMRHYKIMFSYKHRRLWPIFIEQFLSVFWSFSWIFVTVFYFVFASTWFDRLIWLTFASFFLVLLSMIQLLVSIDIDSQYDDIRSLFFFGAWYPFIYWLLNALIVLFAFPKAIKSRLKGGDALWSSPDRGFRKNSGINNS